MSLMKFLCSLFSGPMRCEHRRLNQDSDAGDFCGEGRPAEPGWQSHAIGG
jgi:hypothetical protein